MPSGKILFVTYGGGHVAMVLPVITEMQARGLEIQVLALTTAHAPLRRAGLQPLGYRDFLHLVDRDKVMARGRALMQGNQHPDVDTEETIAYLGINYEEWVRLHGEAEAAHRFATLGRRSFFAVDFMGRVLDELKPDVVVATNSPRTEQAAIEAAVARGIRSLSMIDLFALDYDPYLRRAVHADVITVLNEGVRDRLMAAGIPGDIVRITGNPAFDALMDPGHRQAALAFRQAQGWTHRRVVLWAGHLEDGPGVPADWEGEKFGLAIEQQLRDWVARSRDVALIVRYHPNEYARFPGLGAQEGVYVSDPSREPVHRVLMASNAVVVQTTTVGLEAAVAGLNVFALSFSPLVHSSGLDYSLLGLAWGVPTLRDLVPMLACHAGDPLKTGGRFNAGRSATTVADEIVKLMPAGPRSAASPG